MSHQSRIEYVGVMANPFYREAEVPESKDEAKKDDDAGMNDAAGLNDAAGMDDAWKKKSDKYKKKYKKAKAEIKLWEETLNNSMNEKKEVIRIFKENYEKKKQAVQVLRAENEELKMRIEKLKDEKSTVSSYWRAQAAAASGIPVRTNKKGLTAWRSPDSINDERIRKLKIYNGLPDTFFVERPWEKEEEPKKKKLAADTAQPSVVVHKLKGFGTGDGTGDGKGGGKGGVKGEESPIKKNKITISMTKEDVSIKREQVEGYVSRDRATKAKALVTISEITAKERRGGRKMTI